MRKIIKSIFYRLSSIFGFHTYKLNTPKVIYDHLKRKPLSVTEYELKKLTWFIRKTDKHKYYESLLKLYVPQ